MVAEQSINVTPKRPTSLAEWRLAEGITQREAASRLGISMRTYLTLEKYRHPARVTTAKRVLDLTGVSILSQLEARMRPVVNPHE